MGRIIQNDILVKTLVLVIVVLFIGFSFIPISAIKLDTQPAKSTLNGNTLYVGGSGPGNYTSIQDAINFSSSGDIIYVYKGTYFENIKIEKSISLIGEDKISTVINCKGIGCVRISADYVNISNFTVTNCSSYGSIMIRYCAWANVKDCIIYNSGTYGFHIYYTNHNGISNCYIHNSSSSGGIFMANATWNIINKCTIENNPQTGIFIWHRSTDNIIKNCKVKQNKCGIVISENFPGSINNKIYHNDILDNYDSNAIDLETNLWDNGYPSGGNFWGDYTGVDNDGDGIGDTPYYITGGNNKDRYPLIEPLFCKPPIANFTYSINESPVMFNGSSSYDLDGTIVLWFWNFGDGITGVGEITFHKYCNIGTYEVSLTVTDNDGIKRSITKSVEVTLANIPPLFPEINGPISGIPGVEYEYTFYVIDPDEDVFYLLVNWGDGNSTGWLGPYLSSVPIKLSHSWNKTGKYVIKAKIKDFCDESEWGTLTVTMPRNLVKYNSLIFSLSERFSLLKHIIFQLKNLI